MGRGTRRIMISFLLFSCFAFVPSANALTLDLLPQSVVTDPEGNVQYDPLYPGAHDHDYIDLTEVTVAYDDATDELLVTLFVVSFDDFTARTRESTLIYEVVGDFLFDGEKTGTFSFNYSVMVSDFFGSSSKYANVTLCEGDGFGDCRLLEGTSFLMDDQAPGMMVWRAPRDMFLWYGDSMANFRAATAELYSPQAMFNVPIRNTNPSASSPDQYDLSNLRPQGAVGEDDPLNGPVVDDASTSPVASDGKASTIGLVFVAAALIVAGCVRRKWH